MGCFSTLLVIALFVLVLVTLIRWFEQTIDAVDNRWWNVLAVIVACPFTVWLFPSRVASGRPIPVPKHEPVRGFGLPKSAPISTPPPPDDAGPPPGTPKEFMGIPEVPATPAKKKSSIDPDKIAKLRQKMREQGMLPPEEQE